MAKRMKNKLDKIADVLADKTDASWRVYDCDVKGGCYEIETWSPAGEDVIITIRGATLVDLWRDAMEATEAFDAEEHAAQILIAKRTGDENAKRFYAAAPDGLRALLEDAEAIVKLHKALVNELQKAS